MLKKYLRKSTRAKRGQALDFRNGDIAFMVWGKIIYTDIFGDEHWITFCHSIANSALLKLKECADQNGVDSFGKQEQ